MSAPAASAQHKSEAKKKDSLVRLQLRWQLEFEQFLNLPAHRLKFHQIARWPIGQQPKPLSSSAKQ